MGISESISRFGTMKRVVSESISLSELVKTPRAIKIWINESISMIESKFSQIYGAIVDGGKTVGTHDTTNTTRGSDVSKTVKTYKTDKTIRSD